MPIKNLESILGGNAESFDVDGIFKAPLHYAHVVAIDNGANRLLKLSGMIGFDKDGKITDKENVYAQAIQAIANIAKVIVGAASHYKINIKESEALKLILYTRADVVELKNNAIAVNRAYENSGMPARSRTMVGAPELPLGALVEITAEAFFPYKENLK